jgi:hypothetical protein
MNNNYNIDMNKVKCNFDEMDLVNNDADDPTNLDNNDDFDGANDNNNDNIDSDADNSNKNDIVKFDESNNKDDENYDDANKDAKDIDNHHGNDLIIGNDNDEGINSNNNEVTLGTLRDNMVADSTNRAYIGDITCLLSWVIKDEPGWLTGYGLAIFTPVFEQEENESARKFLSCSLSCVKNLLQNANTHPIVRLSLVTPNRFMQYIFSLENPRKPNCYLQ